MAAAGFLSILFVLIVPAGLAGIITIIYLPVYNKKINARLGHFGDDKDTGRPLTAPLKVFVISFLFALGLYSFLIASFVYKKKVSITDTGTGLESVDKSYCWIHENIIPSLLDEYEPGDELPGYSLTDSKKENGFEIYFYASHEAASFFGGFPDALIAVKYTGDEEAFGVTMETRQEHKRFGSWEGSLRSQIITDGSQWFSVGTYNFFGTIDITAVTTDPPPEDAEEMPVSEFEDPANETKLKVELDKAFGMEGWYED